MDERRFDVFISYNRADQAPVERIAERLRARRLEPWLDRWALTPGGAWQEEIVEGLRASRACAVVVGPSGLGDWAREELAVAQDLAAKDRRFRVFMVLLPGAPELSDPGLAFLRTRSWVDLRNGVSDSEGLQDLCSAITGAPRVRDGPVASTDTCPYRGLEAFDEEHAQFFFGRDRDVAVVVEKLKASRFLAVLGASGSGKSSLLKAGLLPAIRRGALVGSESWAVRLFHPGPRPLTALAVQLTQLVAEASMHETLDRLRDDVRSLDLAASLALAGGRSDQRVVLVVDQFEELFTVCTDEEDCAAFVGNLLYAATIPGGLVTVVLGMRADFYHYCAAYPELRALIADQQFLVGPLDAEGLRQAIEEPARRVGLEVEAGLVETIMADVGHRPGRLPLLEHVLLEVWQRRRGTMLALEAYVASGGVEGALAQRANTVYQSLSPVHREVARRVLLRLIHPGEGAEDTRRTAEMGELLTRPGQEDDVDRVVQSLADQRLLTTGRDDISGARLVEITHEALIRGWPELRSWINDDREALRAQRHLTEAANDWDRRDRQDEDLYSGARLAYWSERGLAELSELERTFVESGLRREARERAAGRRRARLAVGGVLTAITAVAVVALIGLRSVAAQRDIARSRQLATEATASLQADPAKGLQLAADAYELRTTREAGRALREAAATPGSRVTLLRGHEGSVSTVTFSPDGTRVASSGLDGTVRVWDWAGSAPPTVLRGHEGAVNSAAFRGNGAELVSAGSDGTVRIWRWQEGRAVTVLRGHKGAVNRATFSPDGRFVVSAGIDASVRVLDLDDGREPAVLEGHAGGVTSAAFSPDGKLVVSSGADGTVRVWDWRTGREVAALSGPGRDVTGAAFHPDGKRVIRAGFDGAVPIWDWTTGVEPAVLRGHAGSVHGTAFDPEGRRVVTAGADGTVRVWDPADTSESTVLRGHAGSVNSAAFAPDGRRVVSGGSDGTVRVWDWTSGGTTAVMRAHTGIVTAAAFSPDGRWVVSAGGDGDVRLWDWAGHDEPTVIGPVPPLTSAAFSRDGRFVVGGSSDGTVRIWDWAAHRAPTVLRGHVGAARAEFSADGRYVVTAGLDHTVRLWDWAAGGEPKIYRGHVDSVFSAAFSPDGTRLVSAGGGDVRVWDVAGAVEPMVLRGHDGFVSSATFSPDGRWIVSSGLDGTVRVWSAADGRQRTVRRGHEGAVYRAAFSPDGSQVASSGADGTVRVWKLFGDEEPTVLRGHTDIVFTVAFSPEGERLVTASADGTVRVRQCPTCNQSLGDLVDLARSRLTP